MGIASWAEKKAIKIHIGRWIRFKALAPRSPDGVKRLLEIERELASYLYHSHATFRLALYEVAGARDQDIYKKIRTEAVNIFSEKAILAVEDCRYDHGYGPFT